MRRSGKDPIEGARISMFFGHSYLPSRNKMAPRRARASISRQANELFELRTPGIGGILRLVARFQPVRLALRS